MSLKNNPVTYLILSNSFLWGLPLAINHWQVSQSMPTHPAEQVAATQPSPQQDALVNGAHISVADPLLHANPLLVPSRTGGMSGSLSDSLISSSSNRSTAPAVLAAKSTSFRFEQTPFLPSAPSSPNLLSQLRGADGLGGAITMASLNEVAIPIAARAEQLQWQRSNDALAPLPLHWRDSLRRELGQQVRVSQAATVRLPVRNLAERQELPVIITDQGVAEGLVKPKHARTREAVESWAARQQPSEAGTVQVVVVAAEPIDVSDADSDAGMASLPSSGQDAEAAAPAPPAASPLSADPQP